MRALLVAILLVSCSSEPVHDMDKYPYQLTYYRTRESLIAACNLYGIKCSESINGFWIRGHGTDYIHVLIRGPWETDQTLEHEKKHVREGKWHE